MADGIDRRAFLSTLAAAAAGAAFDSERLLWVPGQQTFFVPALSRFDLVWYWPLRFDEFPGTSVTWGDGHLAMSIEERWRHGRRVVTRKERERLRSEEYRRHYEL